MSTEQAPLRGALGATDAAPREWNQKLGREGVTIEAARGAAACAALGCTRGEELLLTKVRDFGKRVLCPDHALELIEREISDDKEER